MSAQSGKLYHLGIKPFSRTTLGRANEQQPHEMYEALTTGNVVPFFLPVDFMVELSRYRGGKIKKQDSILADHNVRILLLWDGPIPGLLSKGVYHGTFRTTSFR